jgi:hypothetical protein
MYVRVVVVLEYEERKEVKYKERIERMEKVGETKRRRE